MYYFKKEKKEEIKKLKMKYFAEEILLITPEYLSNIINGKLGCSLRLANDIAKNLSNNGKIEDYFNKKGE